jgi:Ni/Fe-hydrogenase subunit HybB-like protein
MNIRYPIYEGVYRILTKKLQISFDNLKNVFYNIFFYLFSNLKCLIFASR